jgi:hypothetical protein
MKHILLSFIILFFINGCEDDFDKDRLNKEKEILAKERAKTLQAHQIAKQKLAETPITTKTSNPIISKDTGIVIKDGTLSIDTNKTKAFIKGLSDQLDMKIDSITNDLKNGVIKNKEAGIDISANGVNIDLNKTKSVISSWSKKIESFVKTFDNVATETNKTK